MYLWIIKYTIIFRNGRRWEKERTTRAENIVEANNKAGEIMRKALDLPLVERVQLRAIILDEKRSR